MKGAKKLLNAVRNTQKRNAHVLSLLLIAGLPLCLTQTLRGQEHNESALAEMEPNEQTVRDSKSAAPKPMATPDVNATEEQQGRPGNETVEARVIDINDFNELNREINRMSFESRDEQEQWLEPTNRKAELAQAAEGTVTAELEFIRKVAAEENAEKTVKAIDLVLQRRQERLNSLVTKLQDELRQQRQQELGERRERRPTRERIERPDREERLERARERMATRRTRETQAEDTQE